MFTPYDWQEGIGHRAQYIEAKLAHGAPVLAVSIADGILVYTYRRQARKIYEIYDRLIFAGIGQQSDVEALRVAALEFATREGYARSEEDVTIQRVATAMSAPLKRAFSDFSASPLVARTLFAEVNATPDDDLFYALDYDGDYTMARRFACIAGAHELAAKAMDRLKALELNESSDGDRLAALRKVWLELVGSDENRDESALTKGLTEEAVLLERTNARENRFRLLTTEEF